MPIGIVLRACPVRRLSSAGWLAPGLLALALFVGSCGGMRPSPVFTTREIPVETDLVAVDREDLLNEISMYHGVAYKGGGDSFGGVDCSGLVRAVFSPLGVDLPRTAAELYETGMPIGRRDVRTGDLVFFGGRTPDHVGIAVSAKEMVHASSSRGVVLDNIDKFSQSSDFEGARRIVSVR
jgi:cell wall-associated NlpC family hydrolase